MDTTHKESAARRRILDAATSLFYQQGIRATGIDTIIEAAGVARMTLYKHFPTKEALVEEVLRAAASGKAEAWAAISTDESLTPRERVLALFDVVGRSLLSDEFRGCPFINAVAESPDPSSNIHCTAQSYKLGLTDAIELCVKAMGVENAEELLQQLMLLLDGATVRAQLGYAAQAVPAARSAAIHLIDSALATAAPHS